MTQAIYVDASPLIALARIDRLDLLTVLGVPVRVTAAVWEEVAGDSTQPGAERLRNARQASLLAVVDEGDPEAYPLLGRGEASVLSAASREHAAVLLDDQTARRAIQRDPSLTRQIGSILGTVGLILIAKDRGAVQQVRPILQMLIDAGLWLSPRLYDDALRHAGE